jgi:RHS repeat-associated protein
LGNRTNEVQTVRPTSGSNVVTAYGATFNAFNQLLTRSRSGGGLPVQNVTYAYDNNGNLTTETVASPASVTSFSWDRDNRLRSVTPTTPGTPTSYSYDANGLRIQRIDATANVNYLLDGPSVLEELDGVLATQTRYLNNPQAIDDVVSFTKGGATYAPLTDALGSVYATTDSAGAIAHRYDFDVYGARTDLGGSGPGVDVGYTGRWHDSNGLQESRQRQRRPELGVWLQSDRQGLIDGPNRYSYARSRPASLTDPLGSYAISVGQSVYSSAHANEILNEVPIAEMAAMEFEYSQQTVQFEFQIPLEMATTYPPQVATYTLDWSSIGFVPLLRLEADDCEGAHGVSPRASGYWLPIAYIDPNPSRPAIPFAGPFKYAPAILHEWVHASINDFISRHHDPSSAITFFTASGRNPISEEIGIGWDSVEEIIAYTVEWETFPVTRSPP